MKRQPNLKMDIVPAIDFFEGISDEELAAIKADIKAKEQKEWVDMREKLPPHDEARSIRVQIQVPCFFDCDDDGTAMMAYVKGKYLYGEDSPEPEEIIGFSIDLTDKKRKWKWKLNEKDENHYEDFYAWAVRHSGGIYLMDMPENYHCYRKRKNEFKTFRQERPMNGTSIILQFEMRCRVYEFDDKEYYLQRDEMHFMSGEFEPLLKIRLEFEDLVMKWKDYY